MVSTEAPLIVIGGGVGPMAGVFLQRKIISITPGVRGDSDHLPVIHICCPASVGDRTKWLLTKQGVNPGRQMADLIIDTLKLRDERGRRLLIGVPCNTFHSKQIFDAFEDRLHNRSLTGDNRLCIVNMINSTTDKLRTLLPEKEKIGILATNGTRESGIWRMNLTQAGFNPLQPSMEEQQQIHELIYNPDWGLKAVYPATHRAADLLERAVTNMKARGASAVILGCTELPLGVEGRDYQQNYLIDPVDCLAAELVSRYSELSRLNLAALSPPATPRSLASGSVR